jgi:peptidoglycan/LPS O-acetylase OafA/YrhL
MVRVLIDTGAVGHNDGVGEGHLPQLDALRCVAVVAVLITHFWQPPYEEVLRAVNPGFLGVRLFFVLSGYLITGILLRCRAASERGEHSRLLFVRRFYARRFLRIFPIYYLIVFMALLINFPPARQIWPWLVTYTSNFYVALRGESVHYFGHFWTLAVEEQFYIVWPWLVLFAPRRWMGAILLAAIGLAPIYRYVVFRQIGTFDSGWAALPVGSLDSLGAGALLAITFQRAQIQDRVHRILRCVILPVGLASYLALYWFASWRAEERVLVAFNETAYAMICCWLIACAARGIGGRTGRLLEFRPIVYLGQISYGIYAYHMFIPRVLDKAFRQIGWTFPGPGPCASFLPVSRPYSWRRYPGTSSSARSTD